MFELPKFTPVEDNTGALLLKAAEQAREQQQQFQTLVQKNEQLRNEAFGDFQKQIMDMKFAQNIPNEVKSQGIRNAFANAYTALRSGKPLSELKGELFNNLMGLKMTSDAYQQYKDAGDQAIAELKTKGYDEMALRTALARSMYDKAVVPTVTSQDNPNALRGGTPTQNNIGFTAPKLNATVMKEVRVPKDPMSLGDPYQQIQKMVTDNPALFADRKQTSQSLNSLVNDFKAGELKVQKALDATGKRTVTIGYTEKAYPWTTQEDATINGQNVKINVLKTQPEIIGQKQVRGKDGKLVTENITEKVITKDVLDYFENHPNPQVRIEVQSMARDYIDDNNRRLGINPAAVTPENAADIAAQVDGFINPYDSGNSEIFRRMALTKYLNPQFGKFGEVSVKDDTNRGTSINVNVGGGPGMPDGYIDAWAPIVDVVDANSPNPLADLDSQIVQQILKIADDNKILGTDKIKTTPEMLTIRRDGSGKIRLYERTPEGAATGKGILLSAQGINRSVNSSLGKAENTAASKSDPTPGGVKSNIKWK